MKKINPVIHVGGGVLLKKSMIVGIFNTKTISEGSFKSDKYSFGTIDEERDNRSATLCDGGFIIRSHINAKTLRGRYDQQRKRLSKNLKRKT